MIFDIIRNSFVDGPGIRTTIFFKGCNLKCAWCHNPEGQSFKKEMMLYKNKCSGCGKCKEVCPYNFEKCDFCGKCELFCPAGARKICGKEMTADEIFAEVIKDKAFYENSGGGVTFSGGECMLHIDLLEENLKKCKENNIHTAVDTAGNVPWECFERILPYTDLFLFDIKCMDSGNHKKYTGVGNETILKNLSKLLKENASVWVRVPIIPTVNDSADEMKKIREFYEKNKTPEKTELLPYHAMGVNKYSSIDRNAELFEAPSKEKIAELQRELGIPENFIVKTFCSKGAKSHTQLKLKNELLNDKYILSLKPQGKVAPSRDF